MFTPRTVAEYQAQALRRLPLQFRGRPRLEALLLALAGQHQDGESSFYTLYSGRLLETATGAALEQLGEVVGEERAGRDDASYRLRIYSRLLLNRSSGTIPEMLAIFSPLTDLQPEFTEFYPASLELRFTGGELVLPSDFASILYSARAAGIGSSLLYQLAPDEGTFTFAGGVGKGFPRTSRDAAAGDAIAVVNPGGAAPPTLEVATPALVTSNYFVTIVILEVDSGPGIIFFRYSLQEGGPTLTAEVDWFPGSNVPLFHPEEPFDDSGLQISFGEGEPYAAGDTWTWEVLGPDEGGRLAGIISA